MTAPKPRAKRTTVSPQDLAVAELRELVAALTKRVEALESVASAQRRRQAAAVAQKLRQSPEQLAMLREVLVMAEDGE